MPASRRLDLGSLITRLDRDMRRTPAIHLSADQKRVIWCLRGHGPRSRTDLADRLEIHGGAMTRLTRELITLGVVEEQAQDKEGGRGRPTVPLAISSNAGYAAGATLHPGWLELVLVDFSGTVVARDVEPFTSDDPREFIKEIERRLRVLPLKANMTLSRFLGLGVAVPGPPVAASSRRHTVEWLKGWRNINCAEDFAAYLDIPVWVENDATLAGLAEYYSSGLVHVRRSAIVFFIAHGVGGGVILEREFLRGEFGNGGDIGQLFPLRAPRPSGIDLLGELNAGGAKIRSLLEIESCMSRYPDVIDAWVQRAARQLDEAGRSGVAWLDPGAVILSGALPQPILSALGDRLRRAEWLASDSWLQRPTFHVSRLGSWAAAIGAALLPIHQIMAFRVGEDLFPEK
jgi:predicted NBD/HSP70 family sugar kinase